MLFCGLIRFYGQNTLRAKSWSCECLGVNIPKTDKGGSGDFDASKHCREGSEAEEIVHPADEQTAACAAA